MVNNLFTTIQNQITIFVKKTLSAIDKRVDSTGAQYKAFGLFGIFNYPIYHFIWIYASPQTYESFPLRLIATLLCVGLVAKDYWPKKLQAFLPIYWYFSLLYCLPFFFTFMLVKNHGSTMWITNIIVIVFFLMLLVDWLSCIFLLVVGTVLGGLLAYYTRDPGVPLFNASFDYAGFLVTYVVSIVIGVIFAHNREKLKNERLRAIGTLGESIAHELRTPLRTISSGVNGIRKYLPDLITSYQRARQAKLNIPYISAIHYESLQTACDDIECEARSAFTIIDMLLVKANHFNENPSENKICSIQRCVDEALRRYPFDSEDASLIDWRENGDFLFKGSELLVIHVLFNLFKNSLYFIKAARKGNIRIWSEFGDKFNFLHFKDTASGISAKNLPHVFERFYSKTLHGTGIGLAFCKLVMQGLGGDIHCHSTEGVFTEFVLSFPKPATSTKQLINDAALLCLTQN